MISGIEGELTARGADWVTVNVHGMSFRVYAPTSTISVLGNIGDNVFLHTHLHVKEDSLALFGFSSAEELRMFQLLIGVSGIGPKVALALLSALSPERLALAVISENEAVLSSVPGVGKKTAGRVVLELKGKFEQPDAAMPYPHEDVKSALISLGYSAAEAMSAVAGIPGQPNLTLEEKIRLALQHFAQTG